MANWSIMDREWPTDGTYDPFELGMNDYYQEFKDVQEPPGSQQHSSPMQHLTSPQQCFSQESFPKDSLPEESFTQEAFPQETFTQETFPQETFPQQMLSPPLMNSTQQIMPQAMVLQQMVKSSQQMMPCEQMITSQQTTQFELMFPEEMMCTQSMMPHQVSSLEVSREFDNQFISSHQQMFSNQITGKDQMISCQLLTPQQLLSPEKLMNDQLMPEQLMNDQLMSEQLMNDQLMNDELMNDQIMSEQLMSERLMNDQLMPDQLMNDQLMPKQLMNGQQMSDQLMNDQLMNEQLMPKQLMSQPQMPQPMRPQLMPPAYPPPEYGVSTHSRGDSPREIRNKAEKQRRDKLNHSISELASIVPPVAASNRKIDKTGVLRLTAHYLRAYQYVFGDSIWQSQREFTAGSAQALLSLLNGFLLTTTYRGIVVVVSQNIQQYLGYSELHLLGQNILSYVHPADIQIMQRNLMPDVHLLGPNGELLLPEEMDGRRKIAVKLASEKRRFMVRFKKFGQRSEPADYVQCYVEGTLRKSDRASRTPSRYCQVVRRARARGETPYSSGNDVVFIGIVRPTAETFVTERHMESFRMEYRTRHSVDGEIMECEQKISLVAGYMTHEVNGVNAMHFMHRDDVRWVIFTLREMYDQHLQVGESCYRLMAKNGQFLYMRTRGILDIDERSKAVRSMVCTNTVVDEKEGKHLIRLMKQKCLMMISHKSPTNDVQIDNINLDDEDQGDQTVDQTLPEQDLEEVIHSLVTNLPSSPNAKDCKNLPVKGTCKIDSAQKARILNAVVQIYNLINAFREMEGEDNKLPVPAPTRATRDLSPGRKAQQRLSEQQRYNDNVKRQVEGLPLDGVTRPAPLKKLFTLKPNLPRPSFKNTNSNKITVFAVKKDLVVTFLRNGLDWLPTNYGASTSAADEVERQDSLDVYIEEQIRNPVEPNIDQLLNFELPDTEDAAMDVDVPSEDQNAANDGMETGTAPSRPQIHPILPVFEYPADFRNQSMSYSSSQNLNAALAEIIAAFESPIEPNSYQENASGPADGPGPNNSLNMPANGPQIRDNAPNKTDTRDNGRKTKKNKETMI